MIKQLLELWRGRDTPRGVLLEEHQLLIKAARRCAYDLKHAASASYDMNLVSQFERRADMWLDIFSPDGVKDYRHNLHREISALELEINRLKKVCEKHGIDHQDPDGLPF